MSDLRDTPAIDAVKADADAAYLAYHDNSPWAQAKVKAGVRLNPDAVAYMKRETEARNEQRARFNAESAAYEAQRRKDMGLDPAPVSDAK